jgi:hypothetical protein
MAYAVVFWGGPFVQILYSTHSVVAGVLLNCMSPVVVTIFLWIHLCSFAGK